MPSYLVVGGNRGIGLALVRELLKDPNNFVITSARDLTRSPGLQELTTAYAKDRLAVVFLDLARRETVEQAARDAASLLPDGLDTLIHNSAISLQPLTPFEHIDLDTFGQELHINTVAPLHCVRTFLPLIRKSRATERKIVFMTSGLSSLEMAPMWAGLSESYSVTKAGLNMLARKWGTTLRKEGITTIIFEPGYVDTDMGESLSVWLNEHASWLSKMPPDESAACCLKVVKEARLDDAVTFYMVDGSRGTW